MSKRIAVIGSSTLASALLIATGGGTRTGRIQCNKPNVLEIPKPVQPPADTPREQARAYESGLQDGHMGITLRDVNPRTIQQRSGWSDESVVCYLNGVGDGLAART